MVSAAPGVAMEINGNTKKNPNNARVAAMIGHFFAITRFEKKVLTPRRKGAKKDARK
jgi:hypothetical protein